MQTVPLHFGYKGKRQYIHGTDMYNVMTAAIAALYPEAAIGALRMVIHRTAVRQCRLLCGAPGETVARPLGGATQVQAASSLGPVEAWLVEGEEPVLERREYDEDRVEQLCTFDPDSSPNTVTIVGDSGYTAVETLVAMTKFLHQRRYRPEAGKWWFARLQLQRPLAAADVTQFRVQFLEDLGGGKLTRSAVFAGDEPIGYINFAAR